MSGSTLEFIMPFYQNVIVKKYTKDKDFCFAG